MTDFGSAYAAGLAAHANAERNIQEIVSVFNTLAQQVKDASGGVIVIERTMSVRTLSNRRSLMDLAAGIPAPTEKYDCLVARRASSGPAKSSELCTYTLAPSGYPVSISYVDVSDEAHDKASLERILEQLLRHPTTGKTLKLLLDARQSDTVEPKSQPDESSPAKPERP